jgi:hypothetical protein
MLIDRLMAARRELRRPKAAAYCWRQVNAAAGVLADLRDGDPSPQALAKATKMAALLDRAVEKVRLRPAPEAPS